MQNPFKKSLIRRANRLQRLVRNIPFPAEGVIYVSDIYEHCNEEFGLTLPRTKYESCLSDLVYDTSVSDFPCIFCPPLSSDSLGKHFQHLPNPKFPTLTIYSTILNLTIINKYVSTFLSPISSKKNHPSYSSFTTPHNSVVPHNTLIFYVIPPSIHLGSPTITQRMARYAPLQLPAALHDLPVMYG